MTARRISIESINADEVYFAIYQLGGEADWVHEADIIDRFYDACGISKEARKDLLNHDRRAVVRSIRTGLDALLADKEIDRVANSGLYRDLSYRSL